MAIAHKEEKQTARLASLFTSLRMNHPVQPALVCRIALCGHVGALPGRLSLKLGVYRVVRLTSRSAEGYAMQ